MTGKPCPLAVHDSIGQGLKIAHDPHDEAPIRGGAELSASPASVPENQRNPRDDSRGPALAERESGARSRRVRR